jgi:hypothetical protein
LRKAFAAFACIASLAGAAAADAPRADRVELRIFTNWPAPQTFLGCLNCAASDPTSIWNPASRFGWNNPDGLWSRRSLRDINNRHAVCDASTMSPPPLVFDERHTFYYRLSAESVSDQGICALYMSRAGCAAVRALCDNKPVPDPQSIRWTDVIPRG